MDFSRVVKEQTIFLYLILPFKIIQYPGLSIWELSWLADAETGRHETKPLNGIIMILSMLVKQIRAIIKFPFNCLWK